VDCGATLVDPSSSPALSFRNFAVFSLVFSNPYDTELPPFSLGLFEEITKAADVS